MIVECVGEAYTSETCPSCGNRKNLNGRGYTSTCDFEGPRDLVSATNTRQKYLRQDG
jgi:putative transposase